MDYNLIEWQTLSQNPSPTLFRTIDGYPIAFYFHLDDNEVKKKFEEVIKISGGDIVDEYKDMTPYTLLMVDDKCDKRFFNRASFKASYVIECITNGTLLDINSFIQNNRANFKLNDCMKIIYLREATFTGDKVCTVNEGIASCSPSTDSVSKSFTNQKATGHSVNLAKNNVNKDINKDRTDSARNESDVDISEEDHCANPCPHCMLHINKSKSRADSTNIGSSKSQEPIASTSKEIYDIESCSNSERLRPKRSTRSKRIVISSDEDSDGTSSEDISSNKSTRPLINKKNRNIKIMSKNEDDIGPATQSGVADYKHSRIPYSRQEKEAILKYIVRKDAYYSVRGVNLWKKMERSNICPRRTWMSMQNHFKRSLLKELEIFPFLTKYQIQLLRG